MSYEKEVKAALESGKSLSTKVDIGMVKYFWQSNPITGKRPDTIPKFLRNLQVLKNFTDNELRILSQSMHLRTFTNREEIFHQTEIGVGFYFVYSGFVDIIVESTAQGGHSNAPEANHIITLEKGDYFGELALLQENSIRNATAVSREGCELLGLFKPDIEAMIEGHPIVATKLLQSVSLIIANRLFSITREIKELKYKIKQYEEKQDVSETNKN